VGSAILVFLTTFSAPFFVDKLDLAIVVERVRGEAKGAEGRSKKC
jgi:hypothetical protein